MRMSIEMCFNLLVIVNLCHQSAIPVNDNAQWSLEGKGIL